MFCCISCFNSRLHHVPKMSCHQFRLWKCQTRVTDSLHPRCLPLPAECICQGRERHTLYSSLRLRKKHPGASSWLLHLCVMAPTSGCICSRLPSFLYLVSPPIIYAQLNLCKAIPHLQTCLAVDICVCAYTVLLSGIPSPLLLCEFPLLFSQCDATYDNLLSELFLFNLNSITLPKKVGYFSLWLI